MHKLICPHCHREHWTLSPSTSLYCPYCHRLYHPDRNHYSHCGGREAKEEFQPRVPPPPPSRRGFSWITVVVMSFTVLVLLWHGQYRGAWERLQPPVALSWPARQLDGGMSVPMPHPPVVTHAQLPDKSKAWLGSMTIFESEIENFKVRVTLHTYRKGLTVALDALTQGVMGNLREMEGSRGFQAQVSDTEVAGMPAKRIQGRFYRLGVNVGFNSVVLVRGSQAWLVLTLYPEGSTLTRSGEEVLRAIRFPEPTSIHNP